MHAGAIGRADVEGSRRIGAAVWAIVAKPRSTALFAIERTINGSVPAERLAVRDQTIRPLFGEFVAWPNGQRRTLSPKSETAKAMDYGLTRLPAFTRFLDDDPSACRTTPPSVQCAASASAARTGPSQAPTSAAGAPRHSTP